MSKIQFYGNGTIFRDIISGTEYVVADFDNQFEGVIHPQYELHGIKVRDTQFADETSLEHYYTLIKYVGDASPEIQNQLKERRTK